MSKEIKSRSSPEHDAAKSLRKPFGIDRGLFKMGDASEPISDERYRAAMKEGNGLIAEEHFSPRLLKDQTNTVRNWVKDQKDLTKEQREDLEALSNKVHDTYKSYDRRKTLKFNLASAREDFKIAAQSYLEKVQSYKPSQPHGLETSERASVSTSVRSDALSEKTLIGDFSDLHLYGQEGQKLSENQTPEQVRDQEVQRILAPGAEYKNRSDLVDPARVSELDSLWKNLYETHENMQTCISEGTLVVNNDSHILQYNIKRDMAKLYTVIKDLEVPGDVRSEQKRIFGKKQEADEEVFHEKSSTGIGKFIYEKDGIGYYKMAVDINHRLAHREGHRLQQEYGSAEAEKDPQLQEFPEREYRGENLKKWGEQINEYAEALERHRDNPSAPYVTRNETNYEIKLKLRDEELFTTLNAINTHEDNERVREQEHVPPLYSGQESTPPAPVYSRGESTAPVYSELSLRPAQLKSSAEHYAQQLFGKLPIHEIEALHGRLTKERYYRDNPKRAKREKRTTTFEVESTSNDHLELLLTEANAQIQASREAAILKKDLISRITKQKALDAFKDGMGTNLMAKLKPRDLSPEIDKIQPFLRGRTFLRLKPTDQKRMWQELDKYDKANNTDKAVSLVGSLSKYEVSMLLGTKSSPQQNRSPEVLQNQDSSQDQASTDTFRDIVSRSSYGYLVQDNQ